MNLFYTLNSSIVIPPVLFFFTRDYFGCFRSCVLPYELKRKFKAKYAHSATMMSFITVIHSGKKASFSVLSNPGILHCKIRDNKSVFTGILKISELF